ncbi:MAG: 3-oxoacyl-ACP synthase [Deltaproteobacteria bacterium]|nr:3-oxoacyl-ACP synthase [Deltaproteobacteria bacterium]|tara:strand:+ start:1081 stop:2073 length:993 start_codon:yes stop_codon:yes gene_type:complete
MRSSRIAGLGHFVPERIVTNDDLAELIDTSNEWIVQRTGIEQRRWVDGDVGPADLALQASKDALEEAGLSAKDLDMIIFATLSPDINFPGSSCLLQKSLGVPGVATLDIRNQCTGFVYALSVADQFIKTGMMNHILVVGGEVHSSGMDMTNRGRDVTVLFGDGAGAAVLTVADDESCILDSKLHADGSNYDVLMLELPASRLNPRLSPEMLDEGRHYPQMDGRKVFRNAVTELPKVVTEVLEANGYTTEDIDLLIPHQANLRINQMAARTLGLREDQVFNNIQKYGNTTAASIPIALHEAVEAGLIKKGDLVVLAAFGAGLTWGANLIRW